LGTKLKGFYTFELLGGYLGQLVIWREWRAPCRINALAHFRGLLQHLGDTL